MLMIRRTGSIIASILLYTTLLQAQENKRTAILVTNNNDSLKVWVDTRESLINSHSLKIKKDSLGKYKSIRASEVRCLINLNGNSYISAVVLLDKTPPNLEATNTLDSSYLVLALDTVFLQVELISEKMNLYSLNDGNKSHFFFQKPGGPITELYDRKYNILKEGGIFEAEDKTYIHQLQAQLEDCPDLAYDLPTLRYSLYSLKKIFETYNTNCGSKGKIAYKSAGKKGKLQIGLLAGLASTFINIRQDPGGVTLLNTSKPIKFQNSFTGGLRLNYFILKAAKKFSIVADLSYIRTKGTESEYSLYSSSALNTWKTTTLDFSSLDLDVLLRYTLPLKGPVKPFINAGFAAFEAISRRNNVSYDFYYNNVHSISNEDPFHGGFKPFQGGFLAGGGILYKRFSLEFKYANLSGVSSYQYINARLNSWQLLLFFNLNN